MILPDHVFPPDIRVENEARALISAGHEVHLISPNAEMKPCEEIIDGIYVHRLSNVPASFKKHEFIWNVPFPFNPIWIRKIVAIVRRHNIEVFHVHDLPLVALCILLGKIFKIPVIFDMHENWPEAMKLWGYEMFYLPAKLLERFSIRFANLVIVVVDEQKERLLSLGVPENKISVIMNTVVLDMFNDKSISQELYSRLRSIFEKNFLISYIGGFNNGRGIDILIQAMPYVIENVENAHLLLVGDGRIREDLENLTETLGISNNVSFVGWIDLHDVVTYIAVSDVCVIPHYTNPHIDRTIPHKLFQYMAMGKPIVSTDARPLKRIIEAEGCGIIVPSGDAVAMAEAIIELNDKKLANICGQNGNSSVLDKYNWNITSHGLCDIYNDYVGLK